MSLDEIIQLNKKKTGQGLTVQLHHGQLNRSHFRGRGNHTNYFRKHPQLYCMPHRANFNAQANTYQRRYTANKLKQSMQWFTRRTERERNNLRIKNAWKQKKNPFRRWRWNNGNQFNANRYNKFGAGQGFLGRNWQENQEEASVVDPDDVLTVSINNNNKRGKNRQRKWRQNNPQQQPSFVRTTNSFFNSRKPIISHGINERMESSAHQTQTTLNERFSNITSFVYY